MKKMNGTRRMLAPNAYVKNVYWIIINLIAKIIYRLGDDKFVAVGSDKRFALCRCAGARLCHSNNEHVFRPVFPSLGIRLTINMSLWQKLIVALIRDLKFDCADKRDHKFLALAILAQCICKLNTCTFSCWLNLLTISNTFLTQLAKM